jgi:hypothetical protein
MSIAAGVTGVGMGMTVPATNNASLQLAPEQAASIAGLRGIFRQGGAITAISVTTAILARSSDAAAAQADIFLAFAAMLIQVPPPLLLGPDPSRQLVRVFGLHGLRSRRIPSRPWPCVVRAGRRLETHCRHRHRWCPARHEPALGLGPISPCGMPGSWVHG